MAVKPRTRRPRVKRDIEQLLEDAVVEMARIEPIRPGDRVRWKEGLRDDPMPLKDEWGLVLTYDWEQREVCFVAIEANGDRSLVYAQAWRLTRMAPADTGMTLH